MRKIDLSFNNGYLACPSRIYTGPGQSENHGLLIWNEIGAHYKLLVYLALQFKGEVFIDLGSKWGASAQALSYGNRNKVISFDLKDGEQKWTSYTSGIETTATTNGHNNITRLQWKMRFPMMEFILTPSPAYIDDFLPLFLSAPLIMLDTTHEGSWELEFYHTLVKHGYKGLLLCDDIHMHNGMRRFWRGVTHTKYDLSHIGHRETGTGLVDFSDRVIVAE